MTAVQVHGISGYDVAARRGHYTALDGLRGFAALWVIAGHAGGLSGKNDSFLFHVICTPSLAVDLFIMLSGFLMASVHGADFSTRVSGLNASRFYIKRGFRILPLYYLCLVVSLSMLVSFASARSVVWQFNSVPEVGWRLNGSFASIVAHVFMTFGLSPTLYWSTPLPDWSLSLEVQFYVVFPVIAFMFSRWGARRSALLIGLFAAAVCFVFVRWFSQFSLPSPLPLKLGLFVAGMLIAVAVSDPSSRRGRTALFLALVLALIPTSPELHKFLVVRPILAIAIFSAAVPSGGIANGFARTCVAITQKALSLPLMKFLGDSSYAAYLVHLPIMMLLIAIFEKTGVDGGNLTVRFLLSFGATVVITYPASIALRRFVELPGIELGRLASKTLFGKRMLATSS
jgi:peptidoglycan/LPS O-acetylase OafA/YrhL